MIYEIMYILVKVTLAGKLNKITLSKFVAKHWNPKTIQTQTNKTGDEYLISKQILDPSRTPQTEDWLANSLKLTSLCPH